MQTVKPSGFPAMGISAQRLLTLSNTPAYSASCGSSLNPWQRTTRSSIVAMIEVGTHTLMASRRG